MTNRTSAALLSSAGRIAIVAAVGLFLGACSLFGPTKIQPEEIIPPDTLYQQALKDMDGQRYNTAVSDLQKLERQHPYSDYNEKAKLMETYANYRMGHFDSAILAADRYMALYPDSDQMAYVLFLKGTAYFGQMTDITRDQQSTQNAIDTYTLLIHNYPTSDYAKDAGDKMEIAIDQLAGKEMSVGRYYEGNGQIAAAINRFRNVVDHYQTSSQIEEALYRLTECNLTLGLLAEAQTAAAVLGHNYPSSPWYQEAYNLLAKQNLKPEVNAGSTLAAAIASPQSPKAPATGDLSTPVPPPVI